MLKQPLQTGNVTVYISIQVNYAQGFDLSGLSMATLDMPLAIHPLDLAPPEAMVAFPSIYSSILQVLVQTLCPSWDQSQAHLEHLCD